MASNKLIFLICLTASLLHLYSSTDISPTTPVSPSTACKSTPDPTYCKSVLPNQTENTYGYGRHVVRKSISQSRKFIQLLDKYLAKYQSTLSKPAIRALQDCRFLANLNMEYLLTSFQTVNSTASTLSTLKADDVQTLLSAIITNQQTCFDGLQSTASAWSIKNGITVPLSNDTKLYSVSLALVTKAWIPKSKKKNVSSKPKRKHFPFDKRNLKMSGHTRRVYESLGRRHLAEDCTGAVDMCIFDMVVVSQDGSGNFTTINDALNVAPNNTKSGTGYFLIYVTAGVYEEYVSVPKNKYYLIMMGDGINQTVITGNRSVVDGWTTFNSATFAVVSPYFVMMDITVRNTAGAAKHQAVALRSGADLSTFYRCSFEGYQDTLYTHSLRQFYGECDVYGTVDFIFGNAAVVLQDCNLYPRLPMSGQFNAITAQGRTDPNQNTGTSIHNCTVKAAADLASSNRTVQTYLGRPWKEYSRTVYMQSYMDGLINPAGWQVWNGSFALSTLYYGEYNNTGPGSDTSRRVNWAGYHVMNSTEAAAYTVQGFLLGDDWLPITGVPYTSGLL